MPDIHKQSGVGGSVDELPYASETVTGILSQHTDRLFDGKYRLIRRLGRGGMGEVYKAEHVHLGTTRVIKVMRPQIADDRDLQDRFVREARLATRIQSPNVATLYDFSVLPDGSRYMVWELIDGVDFSTYSRSGEPLRAEFAIRLVIRALAGLGAIHAAGIVHRDISPENLMVQLDHETGELRVKVIDLGIARSDSADSSLTETGVFVGKWKYASPEHLGLIEAGGKIDSRADLFSMGIVLHELLTGRTPFEADTPGQYVLLHSGDRPNPIAVENVSIPNAPEIVPVLVKALARDRNDRYQTAAEFIAALEDVLDHLQDPGAVPTMILSPRPDAPITTVNGWSAPSGELTVRTGNRTVMPDKRLLTIVGAIILLVALSVALAFAARFPEARVSPVESSVAETGPASTGSPSGETLSIQPEQAPVEESDVMGAASITPEAPASKNPVDEVLKPAPSKIAPSPVTVPPPAKSDPDSASPTEEAIPPVVNEERAAPAVPLTDTIHGTGHPLFGWRSKRLVDSAEYRAGFRKGIIRDYGDMWSKGGCDWASVARGVRLTDYAISISTFENLTGVDNEEIHHWLEEVLQEELNEIAGTRGRVRTENVIFWASDRGDAGIGIEMIFRDPEGRVIAKLRHTAREDSAAAAAEEMAEVVADFIEDHEVVEP